MAWEVENCPCGNDGDRGKLHIVGKVVPPEQRWINTGSGRIPLPNRHTTAEIYCEACGRVGDGGVVWRDGDDAPSSSPSPDEA
jgi:hypothetical protein